MRMNQPAQQIRPRPASVTEILHRALFSSLPGTTDCIVRNQPCPVMPRYLTPARTARYGPQVAYLDFLSGPDVLQGIADAMTCHVHCAGDVS